MSNFPTGGVPTVGRSAKVVVRSPDGREIDLDKFKEVSSNPPTVPIPPASPALSHNRSQHASVQIESKRDKIKWMKEEIEKERKEKEKNRKEAEARRKAGEEESKVAKLLGEEKRLEDEEARDAIPPTGSKDISNPPMSALTTAHLIENLNDVEYPEGIKSPEVELNTNAPTGKFRYDRDFLLQFVKVCTEKPVFLTPPEALSIDPVDQLLHTMSRGGAGRGSRHASDTMAPSGSLPSSVGLDIGFGNPGSAGPFAGMGSLSAPGRKLTSEERFQQSRSAFTGSGPGLQSSGRAETTPTYKGRPGHQSNRTRSKRSINHGLSKKAPTAQQSGSSAYGAPNAASLANLEPVTPLEVSANRQITSSAGPVAYNGAVVGTDSPKMVIRKVRALLNKLTMENFDSISDQIVAWTNKSEKERDGGTLLRVTLLVFHNAMASAAWCGMYARLCRKMVEQISQDVQDDGVKNSDGKPIAGGQLFRKHLLNRCQADLERGWTMREKTSAVVRSEETDDETVKAANEQKGAADESELYADESRKARRRGLSLIKFIGELFKVQMLTERVIHEVVKVLLGKVENPGEEDIESLCQLLTTVGQVLDTRKAKVHMDVYFHRMKMFSKDVRVSLRTQFMLLDVIELRDRKWVSRKAAAMSTTSAAVHEAPRPPPKFGDLSQFGKISKQMPNQIFGPSSVFFKKDTAKRESISGTSSSSNMFQMLNQNPEVAEAAAKASSRPPLRKPSVDFGTNGAPEVPVQRRKLQLLPRSVPTNEESTPAVSEDEPETSAQSGSAAMTDAEAEKKIDQDVQELFAVRNLEEADVYFTNLPKEHRFRLVKRLVDKSLESKEADVKLVVDFFSQAASKGQCDAATFEEGFLPSAELLDDTAMDAPKAVDYMAMLVRGAQLDKDEEKLKRIAEKSEFSSEKLLRLVARVNARELRLRCSRNRFAFASESFRMSEPRTLHR